MRHHLRQQQTILAFTSVAIVTLLSAANTGPITKLTLDPAAEVVPLFDGRDDGRFDVRMTAHNAYRANVVIANQTEEPLTVALPKAAVGVHVLPQFNPSGFLPGASNPFGQQSALQNSNVAASGNVAQSTAGPMQSTGLNNGPGQNQNPFGFPSVPAEWKEKPELATFAGFATIPAGKSIQLQMRTVCLDHGRPPPMSRMTYRLTPLDEYTADPVLAELLECYSPRTEQEAMQAAAWHVADGLTWEQLRTLSNNPLSTTFKLRHVNDARALVEQAQIAAVARPRTERETASVVGAR
jgi:hypothetical protein